MKSKALKFGIVLFLIIAVILTMVLLLLPSHPNGWHQESRFIVEPFVSGAHLQLCSDVHTLDAPSHEYIWTDLSDLELIEQLATDNENIEIQFVGTTHSGHNHYLISICNQENGTKDYYALISYGSDLVEKQKLNRYTLASLSTTFYDDCENRVGRKILFPSILIDDDELPFLQLVSGEKYPVVLIQNAFFTSSADVLTFMTNFYSESQWYDTSDSGSGELIVSLADDIDSSIIDEFNLYESAFRIIVSEADSGYEIGIEK